MLALIASLIFLLLVLILIFPGSAQDLMMARVPIEARPDPDRFGMRLVPTAAIFVFGFALFRGWEEFLHKPSARFVDPLHIRIAEVGAVTLLIVGVFGCILFPQIANKRAITEPDYQRGPRGVVVAIQIFGVICLLLEVQLFRRSIQ
jgi:hypothetical protein